jgi:hypothetical protein
VHRGEPGVDRVPVDDPLVGSVREGQFPDTSAISGNLSGMDDEIRRRLLRAVIGEDQPGRGQVRRWTVPEAAERARLADSATRRGLRDLSEQDPPLVWGDVDAGTGEELWWLLPLRMRRESGRLVLLLASCGADARWAP